jgi:hypothetical protein
MSGFRFSVHTAGLFCPCGLASCSLHLRAEQANDILKVKEAHLQRLPKIPAHPRAVTPRFSLLRRAHDPRFPPVHARRRFALRTASLDLEVTGGFLTSIRDDLILNGLALIEGA